MCNVNIPVFCTVLTVRELAVEYFQGIHLSYGAAKRSGFGD